MHSLAHLLALISLPTLQTQPDTTARISGHALSAYNGRPIAGVTISVAAVERFTVTDSTGGVTLSGLPAGPQRLRGSYGGRGTEQEFEFALRAGRVAKSGAVLGVRAAHFAPRRPEARVGHL